MNLFCLFYDVNLRVSLFLKNNCFSVHIDNTYVILTFTVLNDSGLSRINLQMLILEKCIHENVKFLWKNNIGF